MKSFINQVVFSLPATRGIGYKINRKKKFIFFTSSILLAVVCLCSCFNYYKTNRVNSADAETLQKLMMNGKYFILHTNEQTLELTRIQLNNENLEADVNSLVPEHQNYLHPKSITANRFKEIDQDKVLLEVHLYTHGSATNQSHVSIPLKNFYQMDVYEFNEKATSRSKTRSIIGISLATAGVAVLVIAIISVNNDLNSTSSTPSQNNNNNNYNGGNSWGEGCSPQVYAVNGTESKLAGILYSGAIFAPLQRTDYLPLSGIDVNNEFHLQVRGGRNEEQIIHDAKLVTVTHDKEDHVLFDRYGKALMYRPPVKPVKAFIGRNRDIKKAILEADENCYSFTNQSPGQNTSDILLDFKRPAGVHSGKLIVRAKNSSWAIYLFRQFKSLYGDSYADLVQRKDKADPKKLLQCELDQSLPLSVSVKDGDSWRFVDYFYTPGNEAFRDMIMELDLADLHTDHIQIKLETTFKFWDLDYVGMDFSSNHSCNVTYTPANSNPWQHGGSQLNVPDADGNIHLSDKEHLDLDFAIKPATGANLINSYFLAGSGYYHDNTRFGGSPQLNKLAAFSHKGAFDKFSRETFNELMALLKSNSANSIASNN